MAYATTVPILSGLAILATVTGVSIGRSTVAEINPVHFKPASHAFYTDLVPYRSSGSQPAELAGGDYFQPEPAYSAAPGCVGCDDYPVDYRPRHDKSVDGIEDGWSPSSGAAQPAAAESVLAEPPPANRQWIERYTTYTIVTEVVDRRAEQEPAPNPEAPPEES